MDRRPAIRADDSEGFTERAYPLKRRYCLVFNPNAGYGRSAQYLEKIENRLRKLSIQFTTKIVNSISEAQDVMRAAIYDNQYIVIIGGDGSIRVAADIVHQLNSVLAIIPLGRGNDNARMLKIPLDPIKACDVLINGQESLVDLAEVNNEIFLGISSVGLDSIANKIAGDSKFFTGRLAYLYGGLRALMNWRFIKFKVTIDGKVIHHSGYSVVVANAPNYGGGMMIAPNADPRDGLLSVVLVGEIPKWRFLVNIFKVYKGKHTNEPGFSMLYGKHIIIETESKYTVIADGDFISPPPAEIRVLPKALRVLVPPT